MDVDKFSDNQNEKDPYDDQPLKIIEVRNVHKTYLLGVEGVTALRGIVPQYSGVTFSIDEREFITFLGTSGCGKTTLLNILGSIDLPTKGDVVICGQRIKAATEDKYLASLRLSYLGFVFQTFNLIQSLTALENVELPMTLKGDQSKSYVRERALELLTMVGLKDRVNHFPNQLSGGGFILCNMVEQQRVTIARALANNPKILLLDEPTGDLDTKNSDLIMNIIVDLNRNKGITIAMVTHDTNLKNYGTRTIRMLDGKVANIEVNSQENRENHIRQLKACVQAYSDNPLGGAGVRSGAHNQSSTNKTEKRKPMDYAALSYNPKKQQEMTIGQGVAPFPNIALGNAERKQLFLQNKESLIGEYEGNSLM